MRWGAACAVVLVLAAAPAYALPCRQWVRLGPPQRAAAIDAMIVNVVNSHVAQQYHVSKQKVARCLERYASRIEGDFDDVCSDRRTAGMQAIPNVFNRYVWGCVR